MSATILVIDDDSEARQLIEMVLRREGHTVVGADSGASGLQAAASAPPDLILLDKMMPGMDGVAVLRAIRASPELRDTPVMMFTARTQVADKLISFEAGVDDYVTKPTRPAELAQRVEALLTRSTSPLRQRAPGQLFAVVTGVRGGAGATTTALNLAAAIAVGGRETVLVDMDAGQGHIAYYLGRPVAYSTSSWLAQPDGDLLTSLTSHLVRYRDNLELLLAEGSPLAGDALPGPEKMEAAAKALAATGKHVVIDLGSNPDRAALPLLQRAAPALLCLGPDPVSLAAAKQYYRQLQAGGVQVQALLIDFGLTAGRARAEIEDELGSELLDVVKLDGPAIDQATTSRVPLVYLAPASAPAQQFQKLAEHLVATGKESHA